MGVAAGLQIPDKYRASIENLKELSWVSEKRNNALALYAELPVPPAPSRDRNFPSLSPADVEALSIGSDFPKLSCENKQVVLCSLSDALTSEEEKIRSVFGEVLKPSHNKWAALNQALWQGGAFVRIPKNLDVAAPIFIEHDLVDGSSSFPRILIIAEPGSRAIVVDHYHSRHSGPAFVSPVIEVVASENAFVHYVQIQEWGKETHHLSAGRFATQRNSEIIATTCMLGGRRTVSHLELSLQGEGSRGNIFGLVFGNDEQVFEHYTLQEHLARQTQSDLLIKVALKGKSYSHFDGLIWIEKGATKTSAYQQNRNLLLSREAKADSTPRLEILDNDILGCTHGAAVGPVDEEQLFYLECRGISRAEAEALVVEGFFEQVLSRITVESLRERLAAELSNRLRGERGK